MKNKLKWHSILLVGLVLILASSVIGCAPVKDGGGEPPPPPPNGVIDALDTGKLLDIGYNEPNKVVTVEGVIVRTYYAKNSKGQPTFLNFHDPYQGYFTALIWGSDRANFPPNPESYFLHKKVRVKGAIEIYKGDPEIILRQQSQIWIVK